MTKVEFATVMAYLSAHAGKPMPTDQAEVYFDLLGDLPAVALQVAAKRALLESQFPGIPPVGALRKLAIESMQTHQMHHGEAWRLLLNAVHRYGLDGRAKGIASLPEHMQSSAGAVWDVLCDTPNDGLPTVFAQFRDVFNGIKERDRKLAILPPQVAEQVNQIARGIGNEKKQLPPPSNP